MDIQLQRMISDVTKKYVNTIHERLLYDLNDKDLKGTMTIEEVIDMIEAHRVKCIKNFDRHIELQESLDKD